MFLFRLPATHNRPRYGIAPVWTDPGTVTGTYFDRVLIYKRICSIIGTMIVGSGSALQAESIRQLNGSNLESNEWHENWVVGIH